MCTYVKLHISRFSNIKPDDKIVMIIQMSFFYRMRQSCVIQIRLNLVSITAHNVDNPIIWSDLGVTRQLNVLMIAS